MHDLYPPTEPDWNELFSLEDALDADGEKLRQLTGDDHGPWDWNPFTGQPVPPFPPGATFVSDRDATLAATRRLLDADPVAAALVAATVSTVQSTNESRPAFVKRMVRAWLDEMGRSPT